MLTTFAVDAIILFAESYPFMVAVLANVQFPVSLVVSESDVTRPDCTLVMEFVALAVPVSGKIIPVQSISTADHVMISLVDFATLILIIHIYLALNNMYFPLCVNSEVKIITGNNM